MFYILKEGNTKKHNLLNKAGKFISLVIDKRCYDFHRIIIDSFIKPSLFVIVFVNHTRVI